MQEITIPDGHKATILGGTIRIEPIEKKCEFKRGDIIKVDRCIAIFNEAKTSSLARFSKTNDVIYYYVCYGWRLTYDDYGVGSLSEQIKKGNIRLATPEEQQILFDALAKEGKYWDAETLEVKDFIKVPESIGIYKWFGKEDKYECGDNLFIGFNNDTQLLGYDDSNKCYLVYPKRNSWQKVQCHLQPCKRADLGVGDTAFYSDEAIDSLDDVTFACKVINDRQVVFDASNGLLIHSYQYDYWYKLIPINK